MSGLNLYEVASELRAIDFVLDDLEGEVYPGLEADLDALEMQWSDKVESLVGWIREHEAKAHAFKLEEERFARRRKVSENTVRRVKDYIREAMAIRQLTHTDTGKFVVRVQRNPTPSIEWKSVDPFPRDFVRIVEEEDRKKVQEAHRAGTLPPGFEVNYGTHLRIK